MVDQLPIFDSHLHIINKRFKLVENNGYLPPEFLCDQYLKRMAHYHLLGGVVVSGSFQAYDQEYLMDALQTLGPSYVGVTQMPISVSDEEIIYLNKRGVRAVRFNLKRGGSEDIKNLKEVAARIYEVAKWHVELYIDSKELPAIKNVLIKLPAVSVDHLGLSQSGFSTLLRLVDKGVKVKATGFSRVDLNVAKALKTLYSANPTALMFGSDLPSTRAPIPYMDDDYSLVLNTLGPEAAKKVFSENAIKFYRPRLEVVE